jgi:hypothetical protein
MRRAAAGLALVFGIWLLAFPFVFSLFHRTQAAETVTREFRGVLSKPGVAQLDRNYATIRGLGTQFIGELRPALARDLGMSTAQFDRYLAAHFPATARGVRELPGAVALVDPVIPRLDRITASGDFAQVDDLPGLGLPIDSLPWIVLGLGVVVSGLAALALVTGSRAALGGVLVVCTGIVVAAFAFSLPAKFQATHRVVAVGRAALSQRAADTATATVATVDAMAREVPGRLVPAVAARLGVPPERLSAQIVARYPAIARGLAEWPSIKPGAADLARRQRATVDDFRTGDGAPFRTLPWLIIGPAAVCALLALGALVLSRRPRSDAAGRAVADRRTPAAAR